MFYRLKLPAYVDIVKNPYDEEDSECIEGIKVDGEWHPNIEKYIKKYNIKALYLNTSTGWIGKDYSFLKDLENLVELQILDPHMVNISALERLDKLEYLNIAYFPDEYIDFKKLSNLKKCSLGYPKNIKSLFEVKTLQCLALDELKLKDYSDLRKLVNLKELYIGNSSIPSLDFLNEMLTLEKLSLVNCRKINNFSPISLFVRLKYLDLRGCSKLEAIDFVKPLKNLEHLVLGNSKSIKSIKPLSGCLSLKIASFPNIIDGDLSPLEKLPNLSNLFIQNKKHYSHKCIKRHWDNPNIPEPLVQEKITK